MSVHSKSLQSIHVKSSKGDRIFYVINCIFLGLLALIILYPLYFIIIAAISDPDAVLAGEVVLYPVKVTLSGFAKILERTDVWRGYLNTIIYTAITVVLSLVTTIPAGWALSRKNLVGKKFFMIYFIIPMFFGGGLIPFYNVMSSLHLVNTIWSVILPAILSVWNLFMTRTFFESSIPDGLVEAAKIDGAGEFRTFFSLVLPLSKAIISVIGLYVAVAIWNDYFSALIYITDREYIPLQLVLREILISNSFDTRSAGGGITNSALEQQRLRDLVKYCVMVVSTLPVICIYPFIQKYFEKGVMIGSIKG